MSRENSPDNVFLNDLFQKYKKLVMYIAIQYTNTPEDREDLFQTIWLKIVQHSDTLRVVQDTKLPAYIGVLAKNTAINYTKHEELIRRLCSEDTDSALAGESSHRSVEDAILFLERRDHLSQAMARLQTTDRLLLEEKFFLDMSNQEIAAGIGCREKIVSMKIFRAKQRLLKILREEDA